MLTAVASLVNGGELMRPYIVKEVSGPDGHRLFQPVAVRRTVSEGTSRTLSEMMGAVVDGSPGHGAQTAGYTTGGKTGTTTFPDRAETIASFVGFSPREDPAIIMLVKIDAPKDDTLGGAVAAPIYAGLAPQILSYLGVHQDEALVQGASDQ
jgi:cell division protein FtsI/penicillin-binding protein 2